MKIEIEMPLTGDWIVGEKRGVKIKPLTLPFNLSYRADKMALDVDKGTGVYAIEIDDAYLNPGLRGRLLAFSKMSVSAKRKSIAESGIKGHTHGEFRKLEVRDAR